MRMRFFGLFLTVAIGIFAGCEAGAARAGSTALAAPSGPVVLTVSGNIAETNGGSAASFDLAGFEALPQAEMVTQTDWTPAGTRFTGIRLLDLVHRLGAQNPQQVTLTALNDYAVTLDLAVLQRENPLLAVRENGALMSVRDRGPFWLIFPFEPGDGGQSKHNIDMIWQVSEISVK